MNVLGIFVKQPVPGRVKTRLAAEMGNDRAAELYQAFTIDIVNRFRNTADRRFLCYTPHDPAAENYFTSRADEDYQLWPQPNGSLGERLGEFFEYSFSKNAQRVIVIGSDSPTLPQNMVEQAFFELADHDCVLGPATDGGYYLVGQRTPGIPIFDRIEWSGVDVLSQTVERIASCQARLALLSPWYDVDTLSDLKLLRGHLQAMHQAGVPVRLTARNTRRRNRPLPGTTRWAE